MVHPPASSGAPSLPGRPSLADRHNSLDDVLKFTNVAWPDISEKDLQGGPAESQSAVEGGRMSFEKQPDAWLDVTGPFPQRREMEPEDVQTVVKISAKLVSCDDSLRFLFVAVIMRISMGRTRSLQGA